MLKSRKWRLCLALLALAATLAGCGEDEISSRIPGGGPNFDYYVDAVSGDDANPGTSDAPFKTISEAFAVAVAGDVVKALPGTYDQANGESFPLTQLTGVVLIGDEPTKGSGGGGASTIIDGTCGGCTWSIIEMDAGAVIAGFKIVGEAIQWVEFVGGSNNVARNNDISGMKYGLYVGGGTNHVITGNDISNMGIAGIYFQFGSPGALVAGNNLTSNNIGIYYPAPGGPAGGRIQNNTITSNGTGVWMEVSAAGDLGGGPDGSAGGNLLSCNSDNDLMAEFSGNVIAKNNFWDHSPPTYEVSPSSTGVDLSDNGNSATFDTTGGAVAGAPCP